MDAINLILAILTAKISAVVASIEDFLDPTLKMVTKAAPAKTVGDALDAVDGEITEIKEDLSAVEEASINEFYLTDLNTIPFAISPSDGRWLGNNTGRYANYRFARPSGATIIKITASADYDTIFALLSVNDVPSHGGNPVYAEGETGLRTVTKAETAYVIIPNDCEYIYVRSVVASVDYTPAYVGFNGHTDKIKTVYVSTTGNDDNNGRNRDNAFATIQKAIDSGAANVIVAPGEYTTGFSVNGLHDVNIMRDHINDVDSTDNPRVVINGVNGTSDNGITLSHCYNIHIAGFEVKGFPKYGFYFNKSSGIDVMDCVAHDIYKEPMFENISMGFECFYSDVNFHNCLAYNIGTNTVGTGAKHSDGFNAHYTGVVNLYDCTAYNCEDDGVSHHDACTGEVRGGEWYQCGKGGVASPTHGARVNVYDVYSHDNRYGLFVESSSDFTSRGNIIINSCAFKDNLTSDMYADSHYDIIAINCKYDTKNIASIVEI